MLIPPRVFPVGRAAKRDNGGLYAMNGVLVERDKDGSPIAVATDGKRLVVVRWQEEDGELFPNLGLSPERVGDFSVVVPIGVWDEAAQAAAKAAKLKFKPVLKNLLLDEGACLPTEEEGEDGHKVQVPGSVRFAGTDLETVRRVDARLPEPRRFPSWRHVLANYELVRYGAKEKRAVQIAVNGKTLIDMLQAVMSTAKDEQDMVFLQVPLDTDKQMVVKSVSITDGITAQAVQMPFEGKKEGTEAEGQEKKKAKARADRFELTKRRIGDSDHWVITDKATGRVIAQQPVTIEFLSPDAERFIRIRPAGDGPTGEEVQEALEEGPRPLATAGDEAAPPAEPATEAAQAV